MDMIKLKADVVVIGAGLAGICAAVSASREGCSVILLEKFIALGGNSSADAGVHPSGAHRFHTFAAETGIIEEITETAAWYKAKTITPDMHYNISPMWDTVLYQTLKDSGVTVLRSHYAKEPVMDGNRIAGLIVEDTGTYHTKHIEIGTAVIDSSGDGAVSALAGAEFRMGRESRYEYNERLAPETESPVTMGSSIVGMIRETGRPVEFIPPPGTPEFYPGYNENPTLRPGRDAFQYFFFPVETGGNKNTIEDEAEIYETAKMCLYSAWDRIKNGKDKEYAKNWELSWLGSRLCKRESRRFIGDYVLTQQDIENGTVFGDAIAYGGFALDIHYPRPEKPDYVKIVYHSIPPVYTIPYRCIYSKDVANLFFASRLMSVSHIAHGSVRLQRTLSAVGQAAGTAAAMCKKLNCKPRDIYKNHMEQLRQKLLFNDASVPGLVSADENDLAKKAVITASSERGFKAEKTDEWRLISGSAGMMLWDWADRIESVKFRLRNDNTEKIEVTARLFEYYPDQLWKNHKTGTFPYEPVRNEVEWGYDNAKSLFACIKTAQSEVTCGENDVIFTFNSTLRKKDPRCDEARYLILIESREESGISIAVDGGFYDFARFVTDGNDMYNAEAKCPVFEISPAPAYAEAFNLSNGVNRRFSYNPVMMWQSDPSLDLPQYVDLTWNEIHEIKSVRVTFDSIKRTYREMPFDCGKRASDLLVRDYDIETEINGEWVKIAEEKDNYHRFRTHNFNGVKTGKIRLTVNKTWGSNARIYEIRVY